MFFKMYFSFFRYVTILFSLIYSFDIILIASYREGLPFWIARKTLPKVPSPITLSNLKDPIHIFYFFFFCLFETFLLKDLKITFFCITCLTLFLKSNL